MALRVADLDGGLRYGQGGIWHIYFQMGTVGTKGGVGLEIWELFDPLPIMQLLGHTNH